MNGVGFDNFYIIVFQLKGIRFQSHFRTFIFIVDKFIPFAKITVAQKIVSKLNFKYYTGLLFS